MSHVFTNGFVGSVGLVLDVCGAFFLAESFVIKKREETLRETRSYWDGNPYSLRSAVYQAIEARVGFGFLFLGFLGQFLAYTGWFTTGENRWPIPMLASGVVGLGIAILVVRQVSRRSSRRMVATEWGDSMTKALTTGPTSNDPAKLEEIASSYAIALDVRRQEGEGTDVFVQRLTESLKGWREPQG